MADWRFILAERDGDEVGELWQGRGRQVALPLNGIPTMSMQIDLDNPMVDVILGSSALERLNLLVKGYRNGTRLLVADLASGEESASETDATFALSAAGGISRLIGRLVGKTTAGYADGTPLSTKDLGQIAKGMIDVVNAEADCGIRPGTINPSSSSFVGPWYFKDVAEAIAEIGPGLLGGFDFEVVPEEPVADAGGVKIGTFKTWGSLGTTRDDAVFEYGVGLRNVGSYRRPIDATPQSLANKGWALPPGFPDSVEAGLTVQSAFDTPARTARGLHESVVSADLEPNALRLQLAQEHVRVRKQPREQVFFTPVPGLAPEIGVDYNVGDTVPARAVRGGVVRFDAYFRIYGATFSIDDFGNESVELALVNEG